jgi:hypothetical protein
MSSKEFSLFNALASSLSQPCTHVESLALLVHSTLVANGFIPLNIQSGSFAGQISLIPSDWHRATPDLFTFSYFGNVELKCVPVGSARLAVHATDERGKIYSVNLDFQESTQLDPETVIKFVKANLLNLLADKTHHPPEEKRRLLIVDTHQPRSGYVPPRAPLFGTPIGPGELVGPEHPLFTGEGQTGEGRQRGVRDPRFDPLGPGYIGEPDTDHFPPPPFGEPPGGRRPPGRAPLRGPHANLGPGDMFM